MAEVITFDTGQKTFDINGKCEISFNPYDVFFLGRVTDAAKKLDTLQSELQTLGEDWAIIYQKSKETDAKMREVIDGLFQTPICDVIFADVSLFAIGNGLPLWSNLLFAVVDHMDAGLEDEKKKAQVRIRKYSEKYKK